MPKFISIDRNGVPKSHNVEQGFPLTDLYRRVGFKSAESFEQQHVWEINGRRIVLLAKTKGRNGQNNTYVLPFADKLENNVFYGSIALLNIGEDGTYHDLDIDEWNNVLSEVPNPNDDFIPSQNDAPIEVKPQITQIQNELIQLPNEEETLPPVIPQPQPEAKSRKTRKVKAKVEEEETPKVSDPPMDEPTSNQYVQELEEENYNTTKTIYHATIYNTLIVPVVQFRSNICCKLAEILNETTLAINLEKGVYNYAIREAKFNSIVRKWDNPAFMQLYTDRLRTIYTNLNTQPEFCNRVKSGELDPETLAYITHQEMNPVRWKESIERKIKRDDSKFNAKVEASTDMFVCKNWKCKSKRCTYYEMQTRSADEPATVFITCLDCGKHWKM